MRMKPASRGASRGFGPRLSIRVCLRVYLPVDIGGALIGGIRHPRVFILIHTSVSPKNGSFLQDDNHLELQATFWKRERGNGTEKR